MGTRSDSDWVKGGVAKWDWLEKMHKAVTNTTKTHTSPCMCPFQPSAQDMGRQQASMHSTLRSCTCAGVRKLCINTKLDPHHPRDTSRWPDI